jgi:hypothetical protein
MRVIPLSGQMQAALGMTHQVIVTHADLTEPAAATAQTLALLTVPVGAVVDAVYYALPTPFANSADAAFNDIKVQVGDGNDTDRFLHGGTAGTGAQINVNGTEVLYIANTRAQLTTAPFVYSTADTVDALFGSMTGKSLVDLDTGEIHFFLRIIPLAQLVVGQGQ